MCALGGHLSHLPAARLRNSSVYRPLRAVQPATHGYNARLGSEAAVRYTAAVGPRADNAHNNGGLSRRSPRRVPVLRHIHGVLAVHCLWSRTPPCVRGLLDLCCEPRCEGRPQSSNASPRCADLSSLSFCRRFWPASQSLLHQLPLLTRLSRNHPAPIVLFMLTMPGIPRGCGHRCPRDAGSTAATNAMLSGDCQKCLHLCTLRIVSIRFPVLLSFAR